MATTHLRIFDVEPSTPANPRPQPVERAEGIAIEGAGDSAKRAARANLVMTGHHVRSLNWAPRIAGGAELIAYVEKKGT